MYHLNRAMVEVEEPTFASLLNQGGGGETGFLDGSTAVDESSNKAQTVGRSDSSPLKTEPILGSHEMSNSLVIEASLFRTLEEPVHRTCSSLQLQGDL